MARRKKKERKPNKDYELLAYNGKSKVRVLAFDPGSRNMGVEIIANSIMTHPINDLVRFGELRPLFFAEVDLWIAKYRPRAIVAERFQTRGLMGPLIEQVSIMLGLLAGRYNLPIKFITAATWKNKYQDRYRCDLKVIYKEVCVEAHPFDACLIGAYGLEAGLGKALHHPPDIMMAQAEERSCLPLKMRRGQKVQAKPRKPRNTKSQVRSQVKSKARSKK